MNQESFDPRVQKLVASLYGELSDAEERELAEELGRDSELRADLEELRAARAFLEDWPGEDPAPGSIFVESSDMWSGDERSGSTWARLRRWMGHLMPAPAWGFGFATVLLVGLILAGFRIDRLDDGIALRFGRADSPREALMAAAENAPSEDGMPGNPANTPTSLDVGPEALPVSATGPYVTQIQLREQHAQILEQITGMLGEYEQRRNGELAYILQTFYQEIAGQQNQAINELQNQIEGVGLGLMAEQSKTNRRLETLVDEDGTLKRTQSQTPPQERGDH
jgi:hypothetical protein